MADLVPRAGQNDVLLTSVIEPAGATIDGSVVGVAIDPATAHLPPEEHVEVPLPPGYSFVEISPLETGVRCPNVPDVTEAPEVCVKQKADKDTEDGVAYIHGRPWTIKTIAPEAASVTSGAALTGKLPA